MQVEEGFKINELMPMLRRRVRAILGVAGGVFLLSIMVAALLSNEYWVYTTILVEPQSISDQLVASGLAESEANRRINQMTAQILSRPRLSKVIDELELYENESKRMTREEVIEYMREHIDVEPIIPEMEAELGNTRRREITIYTFRVHYWNKDAKLAAAVANRLANDFIEEHIRERVQRSGDTSEFMESELARLAGQIGEVEAQIARVKEENTGRLPEDFPLNQNLLQAYTNGMRQKENELARAESDIAFYRQQAISAAEYAIAAEALAAAAGPSGPSDAVSPERRLDSLKVLVANLKAKGFTRKHPDVIETLGEIDALKRQIADKQAVGEDGAQLERVPTATEQNALLEKQRAEIRAAQIAVDVDRLQANIADVQQRLAQTPRVTERLQALQREWTFLNESYRDFSSKRLDATVSANMERRQKGEQIRVLESAFVPPEPSSPNRPLILALGLLLGLALGGGVALLLEAMDASFHTARDLQRKLRIPVLAAVPRVLLEVERRALRRRRVVWSMATTGLVAIWLLLAGAGYFWMNGAPDWLPFGEEPPGAGRSASLEGPRG